MANTYTKGTIKPALPSAAFTEFEKYILTQASFQWEVADANLDMYFENSLCNDNNLTFDGLAPYVTAGDPMAIRLLQELSATPEAVAIQLPAWETILQGILSKPECVDPKTNVPISHIVIEGATWCDKMRTGEFGGFVYLISRDVVREGSTWDIIDMMKNDVWDYDL